jgi:hypothetical protein
MGCIYKLVLCGSSPEEYARNTPAQVDASRRTEAIYVVVCQKRRPANAHPSIGR